MKQMKKISTFLLLGASLLLGACGTAESGSSSDSPDSSAASSASEAPSSQASSAGDASSEAPSSAPSTSSDASSAASESSESSASSEAEEAFALNVVNSDHLTLSLFDENGAAITQAYAFDYVYVEVTAGEGYTIASLTVSYYAEADTGYKSTDILEQVWNEAPNAGRYYAFLPSLASESEVTFTVTERSLTAFAEYGFVGDYLNVDVANSESKNLDEFDATHTFTIAASGDVTFYLSGEVSETVVISSATAKTGEGSFQTTNWVTVSYADNIIFYYDAMEKGTWGDSNSFWNFGIRKQDGDADSAYAVDCQAFAINGNRYVSLIAYRNNEIYATAFVDEASKACHFGVSFSFLSGTKLIDDKSIYEVKDGDAILMAVGFNLTGGPKNRISISQPYGSFTSAGGKTLFLDGNGNATYEDSSWLYTVSDNLITMTGGGYKVTITLNLTDRTFTEDAREQMPVDTFKGNAYRGSFSDRDGDTMYLYVAFDASALTFNSACGYSADTTTTSYGANWINNNGEPVSYTFDEGTLTITSGAIATYSDTGTLTMVYNPIADTLQVTNNYNNIYTTSGAVLSNVNS